MWDRYWRVRAFLDDDTLMTLSSEDLVGEARTCSFGRCDVCSDSVWVSKPAEFSEHTQANKRKEFRSTDRECPPDACEIRTIISQWEY